MYRIVYSNNNSEISLYEDDKWIMSNYSKSEFVAVRSALEALLKNMNIDFKVEY